MNFDQMMESWQAQDEAPLYAVNRDLLQLVLQNEQADLRRKLRREHWTVYAVSAPLLAFAGICLWAFIYYGGPAWGLATSGVATAAVVVGAGSLWLSRRRQIQRESAFGHSLHEEIRRNLSLVDYELSRKARTKRALLTGAPIVLAAVLINWLSAQINEDTDVWFVATITIVVLVAWVSAARVQSRKTKAELLPRRERLAELLASLNASE